MKYIGKNRTIIVTRDDLRVLLKCAKYQSVDTSTESKLSSGTTEQLHEIITEQGIGPIKIVCDTEKHGSMGKLELLGFAGANRMLLDANDSERYHALLLLGDLNIM